MRRANTLVLEPQPGPQTTFLSTPADIAVYGGAAGGGKTFGLLLEPLRHIKVKRFSGVIFRRESSQIANSGGPWDTALDIYAPLAGNSSRAFVTSPRHQVRFPSGVKITFSHMQLEKHMHQWDGSQIPFIGFDELQHFTEKQFWYMLSRNRSDCGVKPYIRATCNPDPDSFLLQLMAWWIYLDPEDIPEGSDFKLGDPRPDRSGVIRWFIRQEGQVHWADTKEELIEEFGHKARPKSFTFIMATLQDNKKLLEADPDYEANIEALLEYEKLRLKGNWLARPSAGELFKREYFEIIDEYDERDIMRSIRYWDRAATVPNDENPDPDWTAGGKLFEMVDDTYIIADIARFRAEPADVESSIAFNVTADGEDCVLGLEQEPGASGKMEVSYYERKFDGMVDVHIAPKTKAKLTCWKPLARAAKAGRIKVLRGPWNMAFFQEIEGVTDGTQPGHDDQTDCVSGAYNYFHTESSDMADGIDVR